MVTKKTEEMPCRLPLRCEGIVVQGSESSSLHTYTSTGEVVGFSHLLQNSVGRWIWAVPGWPLMTGGRIGSWALDIRSFCYFMYFHVQLKNSHVIRSNNHKTATAWKQCRNQTKHSCEENWLLPGGYLGSCSWGSWWALPGDRQEPPVTSLLLRSAKASPCLLCSDSRTHLRDIDWFRGWWQRVFVFLEHTRLECVHGHYNLNSHVKHQDIFMTAVCPNVGSGSVTTSIFYKSSLFCALAWSSWFHFLPCSRALAPRI